MRRGNRNLWSIYRESMGLPKSQWHKEKEVLSGTALRYSLFPCKLFHCLNSPNHWWKSSKVCYKVVLHNPWWKHFQVKFICDIRLPTNKCNWENIDLWRGNNCMSSSMKYQPLSISVQFYPQCPKISCSIMHPPLTMCRENLVHWPPIDQ